MVRPASAPGPVSAPLNDYKNQFLKPARKISIA